MIPVFEPVLGQEEIDAVVLALKKGEISGTFSPAIEEFESKFADYCGVKYGVAVSSGTTALHLAVSAANLPKGSEILVSASTNIATALAVYHNGHVPVSVDSEATTWNLNLELIEKLITPKTRAIIPVHLFGHPVDMDALNKIAKKHDLIVIEDCAESHGATCRDKMTGSFGHMSCFSFYANKIITTGEGGMILTDDEKLAAKLKMLRNLAFQTPRFFHEHAGYNFRMTGLQGAMGVAQLKKIDSFIDGKRRLAQSYNEQLSEISSIQLPHEHPWAKNVYWMYGITLKKEFPLDRDQLMSFLKDEGVDTRTFFCPMNLQPCLKDIPGYIEQECPVAEKIWKSGLYLPSTPTLTEAQIKQITSSLKKASKLNSRREHS